MKQEVRNMSNKKVILVTGASSAMGKKCNSSLRSMFTVSLAWPRQFCLICVKNDLDLSLTPPLWVKKSTHHWGLGTMQPNTLSKDLAIACAWSSKSLTSMSWCWSQVWSTQDLPKGCRITSPLSHKQVLTKLWLMPTSRLWKTHQWKGQIQKLSQKLSLKSSMLADQKLVTS